MIIGTIMKMLSTNGTNDMLHKTYFKYISLIQSQSITQAAWSSVIITG